jgi:hypothetical protein
MASLRTTVRIDRSADEVWKVVSDPAAISAWFPGVEHATAGHGTRRGEDEVSIARSRTRRVILRLGWTGNTLAGVVTWCRHLGPHVVEPGSRVPREGGCAELRSIGKHCVPSQAGRELPVSTAEASMPLSPVAVRAVALWRAHRSR